MQKRKIIIAGGTGALGEALVRHFDDGHTDLVVLTRGENRSNGAVNYVHWDAKSLGGWETHLEGADAVINLVGKSVNCRYTEKNKAEIIESRVNATRVIGQAIKQSAQAPKVWVNAGSAAIFGNVAEEVKNEDSDLGTGFSPKVCKLWEQAFNQAETPNTRKVFLRIGLVLQRNKGILKPFVNLSLIGFGGKLGSGEQYMTWVHEKDFLRLVSWILNHSHITGIIHAVSPYPVKNRVFMQQLRHSLGIPFGIPNPAFLIRIGAFFIGTEADLVLSGRRVISKRLKEENFEFIYPQYDDAIKELLA